MKNHLFKITTIAFILGGFVSPLSAFAGGLTSSTSNASPQYSIPIYYGTYYTNGGNTLRMKGGYFDNDFWSCSAGSIVCNTKAALQSLMSPVTWPGSSTGLGGPTGSAYYTGRIGDAVPYGGNSGSGQVDTLSVNYDGGVGAFEDPTSDKVCQVYAQQYVNTHGGSATAVGYYGPAAYASPGNDSVDYFNGSSWTKISGNSSSKNNAAYTDPAGYITTGSSVAGWHFGDLACLSTSLPAQTFSSNSYSIQSGSVTLSWNSGPAYLATCSDNTSSCACTSTGFTLSGSMYQPPDQSTCNAYDCNPNIQDSCVTICVDWSTYTPPAYYKSDAVGAVSATPSAPSSTYSYSCTNGNGTNTLTATVDVTGNPPTASLTPASQTINSGSPATLNWSCTNATSATINGAAMTFGPGSGVYNPAPTTATSYTLTCTGAGGSTNSSPVQVFVNQPPTVTCSPNPTSGTAPLNVTWTATPSGGSGSGYTFVWSGSISGTGNPKSTSYSSNGTYAASVTVTDGNGLSSQPTACSNSVTVSSSVVNGSCAATHYSCTTGTSANNVAGSTSWTWSCNGSGGGTSASCSEAIAPTTCNLPWGGTTPDGSSVTAYQTSSVVSPASCVSETRTCSNGTLSGSYTNQSCAVTGAVTVPTVTSPTATAITSSSATLGATVTSNGGAAITARGTCWDTIANSMANCTPEGGTSVSVFTQARTGMPAGMTIYYKGYATNSAGTGYSAQSSFTTSAGAGTCNALWGGGTVPDGTSVTAYQSSSVVSPAACSSETRVCTAPSWTGSYAYQTCTVTASALPDLTAGAVSPLTATVGVPVTLSATVTNIGGGSTGAGFNNVFQEGSMLTSGSSWTVPADWNSSSNSVQAIGAGGGGGSQASNLGSGGGGGGAYASVNNISISGVISYTIGTGGSAAASGSDSYFNGSTCAGSSVCAKGGAGGVGLTGGAGGQSSASVGTTKYSGGAGGTTAAGKWGGSGGGGAAGPNGAGAAGGASRAQSGGGGGGASGGSVGSSGDNGGFNNGGAGGTNILGSGAGAAGTSGTMNGGTGSSGGGGGGAYGSNPSHGAGGSGGFGMEWDSTHGAGGGGGGSGDTQIGSPTVTSPGGGGLYGGGGGGASADGASAIGAVGAQGIIFTSYVPTSGVVSTASPLGVNGTTNVQMTYTFPAAGTYLIRLCADNNASFTGTVSESNEGNNCGSWTSVVVSGASPDLTVTPATITSPVSALTGSSVNFAIDIKNQGTVSTGSSFSNVLKIANDNSGTGVRFVATNTSTTLAATTQTTSYSISYAPVPADIGNKFFSICADQDITGAGTIDEGSNEGNNCSSWTPITISAAGQCSDGIDNNGNGPIDCADALCHSDLSAGNAASCVPTKTESVSAPTATLTPASTDINSGGSTTLSWTSTDATTCVGTGFSTGGLANSSSPVTVSPTVTSTYSVTCTGQTSPPATAFATVTVHTPQLNITAADPRVTSGGATTITWSATDVKSCTVTDSNGNTIASGNATNGTFTTGSPYTTPAITAPVTYTLTCLDTSGAPLSTNPSVTVRLKTGFTPF